MEEKRRMKGGGQGDHRGGKGGGNSHYGPYAGYGKGGNSGGYNKGKGGGKDGYANKGSYYNTNSNYGGFKGKGKGITINLGSGVQRQGIYGLEAGGGPVESRT